MQGLHVWSWQVQKDTKRCSKFTKRWCFFRFTLIIFASMQTIPCYIVPFLKPRKRWECSGLLNCLQEDGRQTITSSNRRGKWFSPLLIRCVEPCSSWDVWVPPSMSQLAATLQKADQKLPFFTYRTSWSCKILFRLQTQRWPSTHILSSRLDYCTSFFCGFEPGPL